MFSCVVGRSGSPLEDLDSGQENVQTLWGHGLVGSEPMSTDRSPAALPAIPLLPQHLGGVVFSRTQQNRGFSRCFPPPQKNAKTKTTAQKGYPQQSDTPGLTTPRFAASRFKIIRRTCSGCSSGFQDIFYRRRGVISGQEAYGQKASSWEVWAGGNRAHDVGRSTGVVC